MDKFDFSCGYCKLLECGGSISSEKTFYTVFDRLLCGLTNGITNCFTPQKTLPVSSFRVPSTEEVDAFVSLLGGPIPGTDILAANLPIGYFESVSPLPPGITDVWRVAVVDFEIDEQCNDLVLYVPNFVSSIGPNRIPIDPLNPNEGFGAILLTDGSVSNFYGLNVIDAPLAVNDWRPLALFADPLGPGSYKMFFTMVVNSGGIDGPWRCDYRYGVSNCYIFSAAQFIPDFSSLCTTRSLSVSLCEQPQQKTLYKTTPIKLCDNDTPFLRHYGYNPEGVLFNFFDTDVNGVPFSTSNTPTICPTGPT